MREWRKFVVQPDDADRRIDRVIRKFLRQLSLSAVYKALREGKIALNGKKCKPCAKVSFGDEIWLDSFFADSQNLQSPQSNSLRQKPKAPCNIRVLFRDENLLVVNKPAGISVLSDGRKEPCVADFVAGLDENRTKRSLSFAAAPLHRLDKGTSGILVFSQSLSGARFFSSALQEGRAKKTYFAVLCGEILESQEWTENLVRDEKSFSRKMQVSFGKNSKEARSAVAPVAVAEFGGKKLSLAKIQIETGRTHQIRAQAAFHNAPLLGDEKYGGAKMPCGIRRKFFLHAVELKIEGKDGQEFSCRCPIDGEFLQFVQKVFGRNA